MVVIWSKKHCRDGSLTGTAHPWLQQLVDDVESLRDIPDTAFVPQAVDGKPLRLFLGDVKEDFLRLDFTILRRQFLWPFHRLDFRPHMVCNRWQFWMTLISTPVICSFQMAQCVLAPLAPGVLWPFIRSRCNDKTSTIHLGWTSSLSLPTNVSFVDLFLRTFFQQDHTSVHLFKPNSPVGTQADAPANLDCPICGSIFEAFDELHDHLEQHLWA